MGAPSSSPGTASMTMMLDATNQADTDRSTYDRDPVVSPFFLSDADPVKKKVRTTRC